MNTFIVQTRITTRTGVKGNGGNISSSQQSSASFRRSSGSAASTSGQAGALEAQIGGSRFPQFFLPGVGAAAVLLGGAVVFFQQHKLALKEMPRVPSDVKWVEELAGQIGMVQVLTADVLLSEDHPVLKKDHMVSIFWTFNNGAICCLCKQCQRNVHNPLPTVRLF